MRPLRANRGPVSSWPRPTYGKRARAAARRGTAILEFAVSIPLLGVVLIATTFFGWSMTNQQHVRMSNRYVAWRAVAMREEGDANQLLPLGRAMPDANYVNSRFFGGRGSNVNGSTSVDDGPDDTEHLLVDLVGSRDNNGQLQSFAQNMILGDPLAGGGFPRGSVARVSAEFPPVVDAFARFTGAMLGRHSRDGVAWRRKMDYHCDASYLDAIRDQFLSELDDAIMNNPGLNSDLKQDLQSLYLRPE